MEKWLQVLGMDSLLASFAAAAVLRLALIAMGLQRRQSAVVALGATLAGPVGQNLVMNQHLHNVDVSGLQKFRHCAAPVSLFFSNLWAGTARCPLTYGTCFQDRDFKVAGRLITMRPLPFFGPGKFMNLDAMTECANARNDAKQELTKDAVSHVMSTDAQAYSASQIFAGHAPGQRTNDKRKCHDAGNLCALTAAKIPSYCTDTHTLPCAVHKTLPRQCETAQLCLDNPRTS